MTNHPIDLYDNVYGDFASGAEAAVRRETYGEDLGQSSWLTADEWLGLPTICKSMRDRTCSRWEAARAAPRCFWRSSGSAG